MNINESCKREIIIDIIAETVVLFSQEWENKWGKISPKIQKISNDIDSTDISGNLSPTTVEHTFFPSIREEKCKMF